MTPAIAVAAALAAAVQVAAAAQEDQPARVSVTDLGERWRTTGYPGHKGHKTLTRDIIMQNDLVRYAIRYTICPDKSHAPRVAPLEGYIGMPAPCASNWYHSGFMRIIVDGEDVGTYPLADFSALDAGDRGLCRMVWQYPGGAVRVSFVLDADARFLKCQVLLSPKKPPRQVVIRLTCYPSFFTAYHRRRGARRVTTPSLTVREREDKTLAGEQNWWAVYYDEIFDVARGEGDGPCALVLVPAQVDRVRLRPTSYPVDTDVFIKPGVRDIRLALAELPGMTNAEALKLLRQTAAGVLADLLATDFTPEVVRKTDFVSERRTLDGLRARLGPSAELSRLAKLLAAAEAAATAARAGDWKAELQVSKLLRQYRQGLWQLKIQALFAQ